MTQEELKAFMFEKAYNKILVGEFMHLPEMIEDVVDKTMLLNEKEDDVDLGKALLAAYQNWLICTYSEMLKGVFANEQGDIMERIENYKL